MEKGTGAWPAGAHNRDDNTHKYICKLLSLPYLPAEHINTMFTKLQQKAKTEPLQELTSYISATCLNSNLWPTFSWSVFGHYTRPNNDAEGWHCRMNKKTKKGQFFYMLTSILYEEAKTVNLQVLQVSENKLTHWEQKYHRVQSAIFTLWDDYMLGKMTANQLLKACSNHVRVPN